MKLTTKALASRATRDFDTDQATCDHPKMCFEPASLNKVWRRCISCGLVFETAPRCPGINKDHRRCLSAVAEGYQACAAHSK